jgi:hypothetical protein
MYPFLRFPSQRLAVLACALYLASPAWAVSDAQFTSAYNLFIQATQGDEGAIDAAAQQFGTLARQESSNPVLLAYTGAATTMKATTTWLPWKKMRYAEDGLAMLDKSLAMLTPEHKAALQRDVPAALEVRFVAANTFLAVPGFMNRAARGSRLLQEITDNSAFASAPLRFRGDVWMKAANHAAQEQHTPEARKFLETVIQSGAPQADAARAQLAKL